MSEGHIFSDTPLAVKVISKTVNKADVKKAVANEIAVLKTVANGECPNASDGTGEAGVGARSCHAHQGGNLIMQADERLRV